MAIEAINPPLTRALPAITFHPEGHSVAWENARPWLVLLGATGLVIIGMYTMAQDALTRLLSGSHSMTDALTVLIVGFTGVLLDAAIVIAGVHAQQDRGGWRGLSIVMMIACLSVEAMTMTYFFYTIQPNAVPDSIGSVIRGIHDLLFFFRAGLPPLVVAFLSVGVRDLIYTPADRRRRMQQATGKRLMDLEALLADPDYHGNRGQLLDNYETQLALYQHSSQANASDIEADNMLLKHLRSMAGISEESEEVTQLRGELASLREQMATKAPVNRRRKTEELTLEDVLRTVGITMQTATKKDESGAILDKKSGTSLARGWAKSGAIVTLSDGKVTANEAQLLAKAWGDGHMIGTSNAAPIRLILAHLAKQSVLIQPVLSWYSQHKGEGNDEESEVKEVAIA